MSCLAAYSGLLLVSVRKETYVGTGWTPPALFAVATGASTGGRLWLAALPSIAVPLLAWYAAGHLPYEKAKQPRGPANALHAGDSRGRVLPFRPRAQAPEPTRTPEPAPLREAG